MKKTLLFLSMASYAIAAQEISDVKFSGLTQMSTQSALETIHLSKQSEYTLPEVNKAIKKLYSLNYFDDIWTTQDNDILTFHFKEKPFISKLKISGYKTRDEELDYLYSTMNIKKGTMYTAKKIEQARKALLLSLEREGYINSVVEVELENINDNSLSITFDVNKGDNITIKNISFKGLKAFSVGQLEEVIANKEEDCCFTWFWGQNDGKMSFENLDYDSHRIRDLYLQNGYLDAKVTPAFSQIDFKTNTAVIEYIITEGKKYTVNNISISIDKDIYNTELLRDLLSLEKNDIFNIQNLREDAKQLKIKIANQGYAFTKVKYDIVPNKKNHTLDISYNISSGEKVYIDDVVISGNNRTLDRIIRRNIYTASQDLYNLTDIQDSKNKLKRTGFFDNVTIREERISNDKIKLIVEVEEAPTGNFTFGGGYGSYDGFIINASLSDKNIFGSGLALGFSVDHSNKSDNFSLSLSNPAIFDSVYNGSASVYVKNELIENNDADTLLGDETTDTTGVSFGIGRAIGRSTRVGISYAFDSTDVSYEKVDANNTSYTTSGITPYINYNSTDDYQLPRSGTMIGTSLKITGLGGDADYMLSSTYLKYFYSLNNLIDKDWIFRYKTSVKLLEDTGNIPDGTSFSMGGSSSVRGYESYAFYPDDTEPAFTKTWTNSIELGFPLIPSAKMRWALFYDYGTIGVDNFSDIKKSGTGIVLSWISPLGPLQFIFAKAINPDEDDKVSSFEFNLGGKF